MSTQTDKVRQKKCPECKKRIDIPNYDIHMQRCLEARTQQSSNSSMSNVSLQNGEKTKGKKKAAQSVEYFPCHLCGYKQTMMELDSHPKTCPNKEVSCPNCQLIFPSNILPAHKQACNRLNQHQRPPQPVPNIPRQYSFSVHPSLPNNQDKQLVANKQTTQQNLYGKANQTASNQISYQMNLPPVPKPEIFSHQQNYQNSNIQKNVQTKSQKSSKDTKNVPQNNQQMKSTSQKLEKNIVEAQKKAPVSQNLSNNKIEVTKPTQPAQLIANNAPTPPKIINPFKTGESAPVNPFIVNINTRKSIFQDCTPPPNIVNISSLTKQASKKIVPQTNTSSKDTHSNANKNMVSTQDGPKFHQSIPTRVSASNNSNNLQYKPSNPTISNQNISQNPQTITNKNIFQTTQINPSQNTSRNPQNNPIVNTSQNIPQIIQANPSQNVARNIQNNLQTNPNQNAPRNPQPYPQVSTTQNVPRPPQANFSSSSNNIISRPPTSVSLVSSTSNNTSSNTTSSQIISNTTSSFFVASSSEASHRRVQTVNIQRIPAQMSEPRAILNRLRQQFSEMQYQQYRRIILDRNLIQFLTSRLSDGNHVGLSQQQIRMIPQVYFTTQMTKGEIESCSICVVQFQKNEKVKNLRCRHLYHSKCIGEWLKINRLCPLCKVDLSENIPLEYRMPSGVSVKEIYMRRLLTAIFPDSDSDDSDYY